MGQHINLLHLCIYGIFLEDGKGLLLGILFLRSGNNSPPSWIQLRRYGRVEPNFSLAYILFRVGFVQPSFVSASLDDFLIACDNSEKLGFYLVVLTCQHQNRNKHCTFLKGRGSASDSYTSSPPPVFSLTFRVFFAMDSRASVSSQPTDFAEITVESAGKISAYYSLVFPNITYYLQTLSVTIGRRCIPSTSSSSDLGQVDVDLGPVKSVSRLHAKIEYEEEEERFVLVVIGRNGAWVDNVWSGSGSRVSLSERWVNSLVSLLTFT